MNKRDLSILIVEDNQDDELLLLRILNKEFNIVACKRVESRQDFESALDSRSWDVIISDYSLPRFCGEDALGVFKLRNLDIPFILVSGTVGEDLAVDMMKKGAHDYIMKSNLLRIGPTIERELNEVEIRKQKKQALESLRKREEQYRKLIESMQEGLIQVDQNNIITFVNSKFCETLGYSMDEVIGLNALERLIFPADLDKYNEQTAMRRQNISAVYELRMVKKNNEIFWVEISGSTIFDENNNFVGSVGLILDISEQKRSLDYIRKLSRAVHQSSVGIVITDTEGVIEYVNPKFTKMTGFTLEEAIGKTPRILKSEFQDWWVYADLWKTIKAGNEWSGELCNKKKNGELFWELINISPIKNDDGIITHFVAIKEDITAKKELELELKRAIDVAEESSRLKSSLLSNISHELRTPMTGILGIAQILEDELRETEFADYIKKIRKSGNRLMSTLGSILDFSQLESNTVSLNLTNCNLARYSRYLLTQYETIAADKHLSFNYRLVDDTIEAIADESLLNRIIVNLVENAIKYTDKGGIEIIIESEVNENIAYAILRVRDTGIGIDKTRQKLIFEEFRQASEGYDRSYEGTGLGLTIAKKMVELMNGYLTVDSELGKGATFSVILPGRHSGNFTVESAKSNVEDEAVTAKKLPLEFKTDVLLVEDNLINIDVIVQFLFPYWKVDYATNANAALKLASAKHYPIVLLDINLGAGKDGIALAKEIKQITGYEHSYFIAVTGYAMISDKDYYLSQGFDDYLAKPFTKEELTNLLTSKLVSAK